MFGEKLTSYVQLDGSSYQQGSAITTEVTGRQRQPLGNCILRGARDVSCCVCLVTIKAVGLLLPAPSASKI